MLHELHPVPSEIRGLGTTMSKLDGPEHKIEHARAPSIKSFFPPASAARDHAPAARPATADVVVVDDDDDDDDDAPDNQTAAHDERWCVPPQSQLDPSVMNALPADVQQSIARTYLTRGVPLRLVPPAPDDSPNKSGSSSQSTPVKQPARAATRGRGRPRTAGVKRARTGDNNPNPISESKSAPHPAYSADVLMALPDDILKAGAHHTPHH